MSKLNLTELQGMAFQGTLSIAAEISAAWEYSDTEDTVACLEVMGINLEGEKVIETLDLKRVGTEIVGGLFKTFTHGNYSHIYVKLDTKGTTILVKDIVFHNRIFPTPSDGDEIIQVPNPKVYS